MAMEYPVQRLELGDVILLRLPGEADEVEAMVTRAVERTETTVRVPLRVAGRADFVEEWPLDTPVTVVRGP
jgi:hypothetical protein